MKTIRFNFISALVLCAIGIFASNDWLNIYYKQDGRVRVSANALTEIDSVYFTARDSIHPDKFTHINLQTKINGLESVPLSEADSMILGTNIPTLYIDTDPYVEEITSKTDYLKAVLRYIPYSDGTDTLVSEVNIRGRGNSTWTYPKKPYRLKFDKKQSLGGLKKAKSFVLLANYIDPSLMKNAVAFKIAQQLGMPYCNHSIPVNLVLNGTNHGSYQLTEKVGINAGSIDIDENKGILWELDIHLDEAFQFTPKAYPIPAMVKDPDFMEIADGNIEKAQELWAFWKTDLEAALDSIKHGNWKNAFDIHHLADYILINNILGNHEISHPKSVFLYKEAPEEKYKFGPAWDFDWTMGYQFNVSTPIINIKSPINSMYLKILESPDFQKVFSEKFAEFKDCYLPALLKYIDEYAASIRLSAYQDADIWTQERVLDNPANPPIRKSRFDDAVLEFKEWLLLRIALIEASPNFLLY